MIILESFKVGVPCISGNNHHYFENTKLKEYVVCNNESSPVCIEKKINFCLKNKNKILSEYNKWEITNNSDSKKQIRKVSIV